MLKELPSFIPVIFILTTIVTLAFFYWTVKNSVSETVRKRSNNILAGLIVWLIIQLILTRNNVYNSSPNALPPKILLMGVAPAILVIILLFITAKGRRFIDSLPLKHITYTNVVRIPVELVLLWLSLNKAVPQLMTFEGRNFDIIAGITAPFVAYFGFTKTILNRRIIFV